MHWVDHDSYFGPCRRRKPGGMRLRERRRYDYAGNPPPLPTALRQLRLRILDARGPGAAAFADRARSMAILAQMQGEMDAARALSSLAAIALRGRSDDARPDLYGGLDSVHAAMRTQH